MSALYYVISNNALLRWAAFLTSAVWNLCWPLHRRLEPPAWQHTAEQAALFPH